MEVEMARSEAETGTGRDRRQIGQHAILEGEGFDGAWIFGLAGVAVVAARHQHHRAIVRRRQNLMGENAGVQIAGLRQACADRAIGGEPMHGDVARIVVGGQQITAAAIDADMDRPRRQRRRFADKPQCAGCRIDRERVGEVLIAGDTRPASA